MVGKPALPRQRPSPWRLVRPGVKSAWGGVSEVFNVEEKVQVPAHRGTPTVEAAARGEADPLTSDVMRAASNAEERKRALARGRLEAIPRAAT